MNAAIIPGEPYILNCLSCIQNNISNVNKNYVVLSGRFGLLGESYCIYEYYVSTLTNKLLK